MAPLILHNVPDDECYVGEDGIRRPFAMYFSSHEGHTSSIRPRRTVPESGSFGKSTRRSRSRTGTPARNRENPTLAGADKIFGEWKSNQALALSSTGNAPAPRKSAGLLQQPDEPTPVRPVKTHPVEIILRGYRTISQQYAAIAHYEDLAGPILEDYPRDPPASQRRYQSDLRDPSYTRRRALNAEERAMVSRAASGEHWVKVTFESAEAANAAVYASPQQILGHLVYAEPFRGIPPAKDEAFPEMGRFDAQHGRSQSMPSGEAGAYRASVTAGMPPFSKNRLANMSPSVSHTSSQTLDTKTLTSSQTSSATITELPAHPRSDTETVDLREKDSLFCRRIPTARRVRLLPAEQALFPQESAVKRFMAAIPLLKWLSSSMIGNELSRNEAGEFDWGRASLYWKIIWWLDATFGLFRGDVCNVDKDD